MMMIYLSFINQKISVIFHMLWLTKTTEFSQLQALEKLNYFKETHMTLKYIIVYTKVGFA